MGRFKASIAKTAIDREMHGHLSDAEKAVNKAMDVCRRASGMDVFESRRARLTMRTLTNVLGILKEVGFLMPTQTEDVDLLPEDEKSRRFRENWKAKQAEKKLAAKPKTVADLNRQAAEEYEAG